MRIATLAVIFAGFVSYGTTYMPPAVPIHVPTPIEYASNFPQVMGDPDDDEDDRIVVPKSKHSRRIKK